MAVVWQPPKGLFKREPNGSTPPSPASTNATPPSSKEAATSCDSS
jgi:hypothetical protein